MGFFCRSVNIECLSEWVQFSRNNEEYDRRRGLVLPPPSMTATMSKTSWFKRNGGKDSTLNGPKEKEPQQHSPSKLFKALRMGSGSLSAKSHSSSHSRSLGSSSSPSYALPSPAATSSASDQYSLALPSLSSTPTSVEYPTTTTPSSSRAEAGPSRAHTIGRTGSGTELRPSQEDPFANLSSPHVRFTDTHADHQRYVATKANVQPTTSSPSYSRRPSATSTNTDDSATGAIAARKRAISSPDGSRGSSPNPFPSTAAGPSIARSGTTRGSPLSGPPPVANSSSGASTSGAPAAAPSAILPASASLAASTSSLSPLVGVRYVAFLLPFVPAASTRIDILSQLFAFFSSPVLFDRVSCQPTPLLFDPQSNTPTLLFHSPRLRRTFRSHHISI